MQGMSKATSDLYLGIDCVAGSGLLHGLGIAVAVRRRFGRAGDAVPHGEMLDARQRQHGKCDVVAVRSQARLDEVRLSAIQLAPH